VTLAALAAPVLGGCRAAPVQNLEASPLAISRPMPLAEVEMAIVRAGAELNWRIVPQCPGHLRGTLLIRSHRAVVDIVLRGSHYSIRYYDSSELGYDPAQGTIHENYNAWVEELDRAVQAELARL
jgi:hypothetical protein